MRIQSSPAHRPAGRIMVDPSLGTLGEYPLDFSNPQVRTLRDLLSRSFFAPNDIHALVRDSDIHPGTIDYSGSASTQWYGILDAASGQERIRALLDAVRSSEPVLGRRIDELLAEMPVLEPGTGAPDDLSEGAGTGWHGFGGERMVSEDADTMHDVAFLEVGVARSRSVCRVTVTFDGTRAFGTASLIAPDLLLTNHHVLHDWDRGKRPAHRVEAHFGFERDRSGRSESNGTVVECDAGTIVGDPRHDWAVLSLKEPVLDVATVLPLEPHPEPRRNDYVFIIQHPDGGPKMIAVGNNQVRHVDHDVLQYWTDTRAGSSGSPVFNGKWQVVGLHHRWVYAPAGEAYPYRNQGRRIERVLDGIHASGIELPRAGAVAGS